MAAGERFVAENAAKTDASTTARLQIRLEALGAVTEDVTWMDRSFCDLQNSLVSVERIHEYVQKNPEAPSAMVADVTLPEKRPSEGRVEFRNYSTRYCQGLDLVIKSISFEVQPAERVGIVGRTGAGKSSLTLALFRNEDMVDLEKVAVDEDGGSIWIDGIDISTVGLSRLRTHLAIIPQDPTLFAGTVRENLDLFDELQDADLWEAPERAHLKDHIASLTGGLAFMVSQNGDNFSTIRKEFKDRTILTIAHRIKTVMDSDKILVLEKGHVQEFESPNGLLQRRDSLFFKLAQQAGEIKED
ncbi:hypothetical protein BGZ59_011254 [Podila verticillata]|nr:hypothetical protein BGZ59_011254 [Podila verticillata]